MFSFKRCKLSTRAVLDINGRLKVICGIKYCLCLYVWSVAIHAAFSQYCIGGTWSVTRCLYLRKCFRNNMSETIKKITNYILEGARPQKDVSINRHIKTHFINSKHYSAPTWTFHITDVSLFLQQRFQANDKENIKVSNGLLHKGPAIWNAYPCNAVIIHAWMYQTPELSCMYVLSDVVYLILSVSVSFVRPRTLNFVNDNQTVMVYQTVWH